jgi:hypothetical protein
MYIFIQLWIYFKGHHNFESKIHLYLYLKENQKL